MDIFKLVGSIMVDSKDAENSISKTEGKAESLAGKLGSGIKTAAKWGAGIAAAATAAGAAMIAAAKETAADLDVIDKGSQRMGITAEQYQELAYAAGLCGVEMSTMEKAAKKLEGTDLNMDEAINQLMAIEDESERTQAAIDLFGESIAYQLQPMLNAGAEGMDSMRQEAHDLGLVMDGETVSAGASLNDMFSKVQQSLTAVTNGVMTDLFPMITEVLQWVLDNMPLIRDTISQVMDKVMPAVMTVLDAIMTALPPLLDVIMSVIDAVMPLLEPLLELISGALLASIDGIKALLDTIQPYIEPIISSITSIVEGFIALINGDFSGFIDGLVTGLSGLVSTFELIGENIFNALWDGLKGVWDKLAGWFSDIGSNITGWFSDIGDSVASWWDNLWGGGDGSHAAGLPTVPYDGYRATLHKGETVLNENDTNKLIDLLSGSGGYNDQPINITVQSVLDGRVIGEASYQYARRKARAMGV